MKQIRNSEEEVIYINFPHLYGLRRVEFAKKLDRSRRRLICIFILAESVAGFLGAALATGGGGRGGGATHREHGQVDG